MCCVPNGHKYEVKLMFSSRCLAAELLVDFYTDRKTILMNYSCFSFHVGNKPRLKPGETRTVFSRVLRCQSLSLQSMAKLCATNLKSTSSYSYSNLWWYLSSWMILHVYNYDIVHSCHNYEDKQINHEKRKSISLTSSSSGEPAALGECCYGDLTVYYFLHVRLLPV